MKLLKVSNYLLTIIIMVVVSVLIFLEYRNFNKINEEVYVDDTIRSYISEMANSKDKIKQYGRIFDENSYSYISIRLCYESIDRVLNMNINSKSTIQYKDIINLVNDASGFYCKFSNELANQFNVDISSLNVESPYFDITNYPNLNYNKSPKKMLISTLEYEYKISRNYSLILEKMVGGLDD